MIVIKKKNVLQELALSLFLMLESENGSTARAMIMRIREKAEDALKAAAVYTGSFGPKELQEFLKSRHLRFTIDCGSDIVKGDVIRFIEGVFNNKRKPAQLIGKRGITAEVLNIHSTDSSPMLEMRVIASGGTWELRPETAITRPLKNVAHFEVMRIAWENETQRQRSGTKDESPKITETAPNIPAHRTDIQKIGPQNATSQNAAVPKQEALKTGAGQMLGRYDVLKPKRPEI
jgi:hypothetical protein